MILENTFKKTIFISVFGHIALFALISFSFGKMAAPGSYSAVYFWGQFLSNSQISKPVASVAVKSKELLPVIHELSDLRKAGTGADFAFGRYYSKPNSALILRIEKAPFFPEAPVAPPLVRSQDTSIIFHPVLPYGFMLYFQDRQVAHVELAYNIIPSGIRNSIVVKRKISSGNLEVDLLSMRYINRYLFMQQARITPNQWNSVKIDLSAKDK
ncbi:MAG: hypothetical protein KJ880_07660 [Candidatus Omnitrophica bacterium]|nr:hypothetical protein [Candidatus Omnitrophota bacterium]MBU1869490.1 hypothetical protein [Candidatus Omnitrophota bacterium]